MQKWKNIILVLLAASILCACKPAPSTDTPSVMQTVTIPENWPSGIPADIPPLSGTITNVMTGGNRIRLFYSGVTRADIVAYVSQMETAGFQVQYEIYVNSQSSVTPSVDGATPFEGVSMTRGGYSFRIMVGDEGSATYDLDGLPQNTLENGAVWPAQWAEIVPKPEGLNYTDSRDIQSSDDYLRTTGHFENLGFTDELMDEHKQIVDRYFDVLQSRGYRAVEGQEANQVNRTVADARLFTDNTWVIAVWGWENSNAVTIEAWKYPQPEKSSWPDSIPAWVPRFPYGTLQQVLEGGNAVHLTYIGVKPDDIADYRLALIAAGFETDPDFTSMNTGDRIYMVKDTVSVNASIRQDTAEISFQIGLHP